jgi:hypothetical protein
VTDRIASHRIPELQLQKKQGGNENPETRNETEGKDGKKERIGCESQILCWETKRFAEKKRSIVEVVKVVAVEQKSRERVAVVKFAFST